MFINKAQLLLEKNNTLKPQMKQACDLARKSGLMVDYIYNKNLMGRNSCHNDWSNQNFSEDKKDWLYWALKRLFAAITRILLLVDIVVVNSLLKFTTNYFESFDYIDTIKSFSGFVVCFSSLGLEVVDLCNINAKQTVLHQRDRYYIQLLSLRGILERSVNILITSSKTALALSNSILAKENRDTVFCQIRRELDLVHSIMKKCLFISTSVRVQLENMKYGIYEDMSIYELINYLNISISKVTQDFTRERFLCGNDDPRYDYNYGNISCENKINCLYNTSSNKTKKDSDKAEDPYKKFLRHIYYPLALILDKTHDFTDSIYVSQNCRERILVLARNCMENFNAVCDYISTSQENADKDNFGKCIGYLLDSVSSLSTNLNLCVAGQVNCSLKSLDTSITLANAFKDTIMHSDKGIYKDSYQHFREICDQIVDFCRLLRHVSSSVSGYMDPNFLAASISVNGSQLILSAQILLETSNSTPAIDNFCAFVEMWVWLTTELKKVTNRIFVQELSSQNRMEEEIKVQTKKNSPAFYNETIPEPSGEKNTNTSQNQTVGGEEIGYTTDNDILKRAKNMSSMAFSMYQFTKGNGNLRTTQDLFTQAEYLSEEANLLYKILRKFSYQVPAGKIKKDLLSIMEKVPIYVQSLQFTVKDHTVGKEATFVKVDHVTKETRNLMGLINTVVSCCYECAEKFKLDLTSLSGGVASSLLREESSMGATNDSKGQVSSTEGGI